PPPVVGDGPTPQEAFTNANRTIAPSYANTLKPRSPQHKPIPMKQIVYLHGEPRIVWEEEKVEQMIINEDRQYAVIRSHSNNFVGGLCNIVFKATILHHPTSVVRRRHRLPLYGYPSHLYLQFFFWKRNNFLFGGSSWKTIASRTRNKTRSSCVRVKVEVDLMGEFPTRINVGMRKKTGEILEKWVTIKYDYVPKYCTNCKLQGHNEKECFIIHPKLYLKEEREVGK
ncbi:hypothetical protein H5410_042166, partial [Solanum commersonii]